MKTIKNIFLLAFMAVILTACLDDSLVYYSDNVVVVVNQGNFSAQDGSISYYYETTRKVENEILKKANNNTDLGAIIQSAIISRTGEIYVVCNNVDKIEVFNAFDGKALVSPFTNPAHLSTPRYIAAGGNKLYVTNWGEGVDNGFGWQVYPNAYVLVLRYDNTWIVDRKISCGSDAEEIINVNNKLYVATGGGVFVIDLNTEAQTLISTPAGFGGAKSFALSVGNLLWASYPDAQKLVAINLNDNTVQGDYEMPLDWSGKITGNHTGTKIYSFTTDFDAAYAPEMAYIHEFDIDTKTSKKFYKGGAGSWFYSVGVSPFTGNVYTADVNNFMENSRLIVLDSSGNKIDDQIVGIGTCGFHFLTFLKDE